MIMNMKLMEIVRGLFDLYSRERFNYSLRIYCYNLKPIFKFDLLITAIYDIKLLYDI